MKICNNKRQVPTLRPCLLKPAIERPYSCRSNTYRRPRVRFPVLRQMQRTRLMEGKAPLKSLPDVEVPGSGVRPATTVRNLAEIRILSASHGHVPILSLIVSSRYNHVGNHLLLSWTYPQLSAPQPFPRRSLELWLPNVPEYQR